MCFVLVIIKKHVFSFEYVEVRFPLYIDAAEFTRTFMQNMTSITPKKKRYRRSFLFV